MAVEPMTLDVRDHQENQRLTETMIVARRLMAVIRVIAVYPGTVHIQTDGPIEGWEVRRRGDDEYTHETFTRIDGVLVFGIYNGDDEL